MLSVWLAASVLMPASATPAQGTLDAYMAALSVAVTRWHRVAELVTEERAGEAESLAAAALPTVLASDWSSASPGGQARVPSRDPRRPRESLIEVARFCLDQGFPEAAVPLLDESSRRGAALDDWLVKRVSDDLVAIGATDAARRWQEAHPLRTQARGVGASSPKQADPMEAFAERARSASLRVRARLALELWQRPTSPSLTALQKLDLLASTLRDEGRRLAWEAALRLPGLSRADRSRLLESLATSAPPEHQYASWKRVADARLSPVETGRALIRMAELRMRDGHPREAIPLLERARDEGPEIAPEAQWQLALAHVARRDHAEALRAFHRSEIDLPRRACCGASYSDDYAFWQGLCREHLGRVDEAIGDYVFALFDTRVTSHLIDLYEAADQFADIERVMSERTPPELAGYADAVPALTLLVMRRIARARDWRSLVAVLQDPSLADPARIVRQEPRDLYATEAERLVVRDCDATVPLLVAALPTDGSRTLPRITSALGRCGTAAAVTTLREIAREERRPGAWEARRALAYSEAGRAELRTMGLPDQPVPTAFEMRRGEPPFEFPSARHRPLPRHPTVRDHSPRPYRGSNAGCVCM